MCGVELSSGCGPLNHTALPASIAFLICVSNCVPPLRVETTVSFSGTLNAAYGLCVYSGCQYSIDWYVPWCEPAAAEAMPAGWALRKKVQAFSMTGTQIEFCLPKCAYASVPSLHVGRSPSTRT